MFSIFLKLQKLNPRICLRENANKNIICHENWKEQKQIKLIKWNELLLVQACGVMEKERE